MRALVFLFLTAALFTPWHAAYAATDTALDFDPSCATGSYQCHCNDKLVPSTSSSDSAACYQLCSASGASTWALYCSRSGSTVLQSVAGGNVSYAAPASEEPKNDPVIPNLMVDIGARFTDPTQDGEYTQTNFLAEYVDALYRLLMVVCSIIAVVMVMIAGLQYILARGNASGIKKAKERIQNAIIGVVLLMSAYTLAFLIDPSTVKFGSLKIQSVLEVPMEHAFEPSEGVVADPQGKYGVSTWQDCMLNTYGASEAEVKSKLKTIKCKGKTLDVHEKIASQVQAACDAIAGIDYNITSISSYTWRGSASNKARMSAHSWGVAIDINPNQNPFCADNTACTRVDQPAKTQPVLCTEGESCEYDMSRELVTAFEANGLDWGGEWNNSKDYMHFSAAACGKSM